MSLDYAVILGCYIFMAVALVSLSVWVVVLKTKIRKKN